ncbi:hydroxymethylglutaryl-CoA lyase [Jatrophihabitans sp. GAS493]|uniref:hydroxymethylglutaryl-CoA lyase n=1 Tax=Jatrophihabitans sp. GAS493 TaxID=1907575 RepID=UPI000BB786F2|nr:hydroxymethylglutaryl-CoA lyase [Jatrophihabitans sp. GAS493]SOD71824.1 hydroxymethylglutaryl-CoA lyase [Jatrophihabitans sp. GAS493]
MTSLPAVELVEVAARDGLQNEKRSLSTDHKLELIRRAADAGSRRIEVTSFVNPSRVPQLADAEAVVAGLPELTGVTYTALVLNERGYERAIAAGVTEINTVVISTDTFSRRNQGVATREMLASLARIRARARADAVTMAVTIAAAFGCPFEGEVPESRFTSVVAQVADLAPDEILLADTIGVAVPSEVEHRFGILGAAAPQTQLRAHFHDTRNTGIANVVAAVRAGVLRLDTSVGGLGGCPFAPAATGNVATEDVAYTLGRMGYSIEVDVDQTIETARWVTDLLDVPVAGSLTRAGNFPPNPSPAA